nr:hypothetical protein Iba_chr10eCG11540 [Ipomoea batatas]
MSRERPLNFGLYGRQRRIPGEISLLLASMEAELRQRLSNAVDDGGVQQLPLTTSSSSSGVAAVGDGGLSFPCSRRRLLLQRQRQRHVSAVRPSLFGHAAAASGGRWRCGCCTSRVCILQLGGSGDRWRSTLCRLGGPAERSKEVAWRLRDVTRRDAVVVVVSPTARYSCEVDQWSSAVTAPLCFRQYDGGP